MTYVFYLYFTHIFGYSLQMRRHAGEKGAVKKVAIAMKNLVAEENTMLHACSALTNLCHNSVDNRGR
jgi:hypothetical protein